MGIDIFVRCFPRLFTCREHGIVDLNLSVWYPLSNLFKSCNLLRLELYFSVKKIDLRLEVFIVRLLLCLGRQVEHLRSRSSIKVNLICVVPVLYEISKLTQMHFVFRRKLQFLF